MRDVTEQLTAYFDATVERVIAEDVLAVSSVRGEDKQPEPARAPRLRPAWVVAGGFLATIVLIGGAVGIARLLESDVGDVGASSPVGDAGDGLSAPWALLIAAGVILVLAFVGLAWRSRRRIGKEQTMQTLERPDVEVSPRPRSPAIIIILTGLLILAAGLLGWWIGSSGTSAGDIPEIVEAVNQAWVDGDADALAALYLEDGVFEEMELGLPALSRDERYTGRGQIAAHARIGLGVTNFEEMNVDKVIVLENLFVYEWTARGSSGSSPFESSGVITLEIEDGLIARSVYYYYSQELFS